MDNQEYESNKIQANQTQTRIESAFQTLDNQISQNNQLVIELEARLAPILVGEHVEKTEELVKLSTIAAEVKESPDVIDEPDSPLLADTKRKIMSAKACEIRLRNLIQALDL